MSCMWELRKYLCWDFVFCCCFFFEKSGCLSCYLFVCLSVRVFVFFLQDFIVLVIVYVTQKSTFLFCCYCFNRPLAINPNLQSFRFIFILLVIEWVNVRECVLPLLLFSFAFLLVNFSADLTTNRSQVLSNIFIFTKND